MFCRPYHHRLHITLNINMAAQWITQHIAKLTGLGGHRCVSVSVLFVSLTSIVAPIADEQTVASQITPSVQNLDSRLTVQRHLEVSC